MPRSASSSSCREASATPSRSRRPSPPWLAAALALLAVTLDDPRRGVRQRVFGSGLTPERVLRPSAKGSDCGDRGYSNCRRPRDRAWQLRVLPAAPGLVLRAALRGAARGLARSRGPLHALLDLRRTGVADPSCCSPGSSASRSTTGCTSRPSAPRGGWTSSRRRPAESRNRRLLPASRHRSCSRSGRKAPRSRLPQP